MLGNKFTARIFLILGITVSVLSLLLINAIYDTGTGFELLMCLSLFFIGSNSALFAFIVYMDRN
jgi:hypothetical protein